jgi:HEXXH motif-containing protein
MIENDDTERYASPVRRDPRPMDGIVHAAFVIARMHQAVRALLDADAVPADQKSEAETALANLQKNFGNAMTTVDQHALLTPLGRSIMEGARAYMKAHA